MIEQKTPDCAIGLTTATLSAWRDGDLRQDDMQQIREHITTCAACRQRLAGFELVARALGRQRELEPGDRVWQAVQSRIAAHAAGRRAAMHGPMRGPMRGPSWNWRGVGAVASVLLVVGLLAYVLSAGLSQRGGTPAPTSMATLTATVASTPTLTGSTTVPGPQLAWQPVHGSPSGVVPSGAAVAPNDGDVAYTCTPPAQGETVAHINVTRDAGRSWTRGADIPVGPHLPSATKPFMLLCSVTVDASNPSTAVVFAQWAQQGANPPPSLGSTFASFDYGAHWRKLVNGQSFLLGRAIASRSGTIYALGAGQSGAGVRELWGSHDQMQTWQRLALPGNAAVSSFWLNPSSGALLAMTDGQGSASNLFYVSTDGGANWTTLPVPQLDPASQQWVVQAPLGSQPWHICGVAGPISPDGTGRGAQPATMTCSSDGGQTWAARPALNLVQDSPKGFQYFAPVYVFAIAGDGAVLATALGQSIHVYRLLAGATVWQDLGPQPDSNSPGPAYYPTSSSGVLWFGGANGFTATYPSP